MKKVLIILGPTATGKTDLGITLAKKLNGEIISCDSRQVYTGLDIGTGKLPNSLNGVEKGSGYWMIDGVSIWLYDVVTPEKRFTVVDYLEQVAKVLKDLEDREKLPIFVGGTGLYLRGLLSGFDELSIPDGDKRSSLEKLDLSALQKRFETLSPLLWNSLNNSEKNNRRRLIRKIELLEQDDSITKKTFHPLLKNFDVLKIGLNSPRSLLNHRIDERVKKRIDQGMIVEAEKLHQNGLTLSRMKELGLEYGLLADVLINLISKEQFISLLQNQIHQYAKRQMTWFKKEKNVNWFDITTKNWQDKVVNLVVAWYNKTDVEN